MFNMPIIAPRHKPKELIDKENEENIDTFRSEDVDKALDKAHHLMKFKHDKEFIDKVLDAQIRVNEIEKGIMSKLSTS